MAGRDTQIHEISRCPRRVRVIPASYEIIGRDSQVTGLLDGTPDEGARFLQPGKHTFVQTSAGQGLALLWAGLRIATLRLLRNSIRLAKADNRLFYKLS